jgi:hypothetical protein
VDDQNLALFDDDPDQDDPVTVELEPRGAGERSAWLRTRWAVVAFAALVVVALSVGIVVFNASAPEAPRGAKSPSEAARQYVAALNAGDAKSAAALSCSDFADEARAAAASGKDPGISYSLGPVRNVTKNDATARVTQRLKFSDSTQNVPSTVALLRGSGLWLVCGKSV